MRIEIITKAGRLIQSFELKSNPFKVGETINLDVRNYDKEYWGEIKERKGEYIIEKIEHFYRIEYLATCGGVPKEPSESFCVSVEVKRIRQN